MIPTVLRLFAVVCLVLAVRGEVLFSEIHYHPVEKAAFAPDGLPLLDLGDDVHEFIELHNSGPDVAVLDGWLLADGVTYFFPSGTRIPAGGWLVIAANPERVAAVYGLPRESVLGPWTGRLSNSGERLDLRDGLGAQRDSVEYRAGVPWPIGADALGADDEWTGLNGREFQYRGRSLERVSFSHPANDPANWLASPLNAGPSPGRANAVSRPVPRPTVRAIDVRQADDGNTVVRPNQPVLVECVFTAAADLTGVRLEWFREDLNATEKPTTVQEMNPVGSGLDARFQAEVPGQPSRAIIRFRVRADRGAGDEVVSPRSGDPVAWHSWFVSPVRAASTNEVYDLFISRKSLDILRTNIAGNPRRVTVPDPPGMPRESWNATQPAILVQDGRVYDVQMRHHGSQFRREVGRKSYKVQFPAYAKFGGRESVFLTDKDQQTVAGHAVFRAAGLPTPRTWWSDVYLNTDARLVRLAQEEYDDFILERYHAEQAAAAGSEVIEPAGEFYKSQGIFDEPTGPYGRGDGSLLKLRTNRGTNVWTPLQRYEWTYTQQMHGWKGHRAFEAMLTNLWLARSNRTTVPTGALTNRLRDYFSATWDVDKALRHIAVFNWQGVWDDTIHNYFLWQQADGRWSLLPWDFDTQFNGAPATVSIFNGAPFAGPNYFKQSLIAAYREEFRDQAWWLNNTLLEPDNLAALGVGTTIRSWAVNRQRSVNGQLAKGFFGRPLRPTNAFPAHLGVVPPEGSLLTSPYAYNTNHVVAHQATVWQIRETNRSWFEPVLTETNPVAGTALALPIDRLALGRTYFWRVQHVDALGHPSPWSAETGFRFDAEPGSAVGLNEVLASNAGSVRNGADRPDFVELVNRTEAAVHVGGWGFTDDLNRPTRYVIPGGTVIPAQGHLVLWCDSQNNSPGLHTGFALKTEGETIGLFASGASGYRLVDVLTFGLQLPDFSVGRTAPNGEWRLGTPTPVADNQPVETDDGGVLRLNEWLASASAGADWLELFNAGSKPAALGGLILSDAVDDSRITPLSFVAPGGFVQFLADGKPESGASHLRFRLSSTGGAIVLRRPDGRLIDRVLYPRQWRDVSQGRVPDGAETVYPLPALSPRASNQSDTDADGLPDAWAIAYALGAGTADADTDGDGWSNRTEYRLGTNPQSAVSRFHLEVLPPAAAGDPDRLAFTATAGHRYVVEQLGNGEAGWLPVWAVPAGATTRPITFPLQLEGNSYSGIFRVVAE